MGQKAFQIIQGETVARRKIDTELYGTRVVLLLQLLEPFYEPSEALAWITEPQSLLAGERAAVLIETDDGMVKVRAVIARLADSAYI